MIAPMKTIIVKLSDSEIYLQGESFHFVGTATASAVGHLQIMEKGEMIAGFPVSAVQAVYFEKSLTSQPQ
jgi:hypothetical protein